MYRRSLRGGTWEEYYAAAKERLLDRLRQAVDTSRHWPLLTSGPQRLVTKLSGMGHTKLISSETRGLRCSI